MGKNQESPHKQGIKEDGGTEKGLAPAAEWRVRRSATNSMAEAVTPSRQPPTHNDGAKRL